MALLDRIHFDDNSDARPSGLADTAGGLLDIAFDDWGFLVVLICCVVAVVFVGVSALGFLFSGEGFQTLKLK